MDKGKYMTKAERDKQLEKRMTQMLIGFGNFLLEKHNEKVTPQDLKDFEKILQQQVNFENQLKKNLVN